MPKGLYGNPLEASDLLVAAQSVGRPSRQNCGSFTLMAAVVMQSNTVDPDQSLYWPSASIDVHMGEHDFECIDCHQTENHVVSGRSISVSVDNDNQIYCTNCHSPVLHEDERLNAHTDTVACLNLPHSAVCN